MSLQKALAYANEFGNSNNNRKSTASTTFHGQSNDNHANGSQQQHVQQEVLTELPTPPGPPDFNSNVTSKQDRQIMTLNQMHTYILTQRHRKKFCKSRHHHSHS
jgi:hypothetical protein